MWWSAQVAGLAVGASTNFHSGAQHVDGTVFVLSLLADGTVNGAPFRIQQGTAGTGYPSEAADPYRIGTTCCNQTLLPLYCYSLRRF